MLRVIAEKGYFIKLGEGGEWETECLRDGLLRFGYREALHDDCLQGRWDQIRAFWLKARGDKGAATRDTNQIRIFYEADESAVFITFHGGMLYWCHALPGVTEDPTNGTRIRRTVDGWHNISVGGVSLRTDKLSGALLRVQGFRGTICSVKQLPYLLRRINDEVSPAIAQADAARTSYIASIEDLISLLTWQEFELLVDLIFANSGWRRLGSIGNTQKSIDLELLMPTTGELAFIQVKAQANTAHFLDYLGRYEAYDKYDRMFFAWHSGTLKPPTDRPDVILLDRSRLAEMTLDAGLAAWLRDKVA